jgi:hypothetical protein
MKNIFLIGAAVAALAIGAGIYTALDTGKKSPILAAGKIALKDDLVSHAKGVHTLFLVLYDQDSPMPMPFGAVKERLEKDAEAGDFYEFFITKEKLQMMNPDAPMPANFRVKVRLDRDGMGGMDQPGDLVGETRDVALGEGAARVEITSLVQ